MDTTAITANCCQNGCGSSSTAKLPDTLYLAVAVTAGKKADVHCQIIIDNREQAPLIFTRLPSIRGTLQSGDYSIAGGCEHAFAVERKSLDDLAMSVTTERERFERELHRLRGFNFKRLLIVGTREDIEAHAYRSKATPKAILSSLSAFEVRYDIPVVFAGNSVSAALMVESWAYWFARETLKRAESLR
jgi:DNA excision repair protein ERCC-4